MAIRNLNRRNKKSVNSKGSPNELLNRYMLLEFGPGGRALKLSEEVKKKNRELLEVKRLNRVLERSPDRAVTILLLDIVNQYNKYKDDSADKLIGKLRRREKMRPLQESDKKNCDLLSVGTLSEGLSGKYGASYKELSVYSNMAAFDLILSLELNENYPDYAGLR